MEGAPRDLTPTLAFLVRTGWLLVRSGFARPTFGADASPRIDVGGISPPVLSADDLFCRGA